MHTKKVGGNRMADKDQLALLLKGVEQWNIWRKKYSKIRPNLTGANLTKADLTKAHLINTKLAGACLHSAKLDNVDISRSDLSMANLSGASIFRARFTDSNLNGANLTNIFALSTYLDSAYLNGVDLTGGTIGSMILNDLDLSTVRGLETINHRSPSSIGIDTIYRSHGNIPEAFLKGTGVDDTFITYIRSLVGKAIEYYSCFLSYSSKDDAFARRLYADLQSHNVRCWFAPEDLKWGERIRTGIDEAIRMHDKLLLILSKHSVASGWVEHEVKAALASANSRKVIDNVV
jgi:uncharacterized protein YjbI with pentapeptide repeats